MNHSYADVASRLDVLRHRVSACGGDATTVTIIAVTKGHPLEAVQAALEAGLNDIGENYADELVAKHQQVASTSSVRWHFQGRLQTNKINRLKDCVDVWQTLDSADRLEALAKRAPGAKVLIQVDSTRGRADRSGALIEHVPDLVAIALSLGLSVLGLMTVAPLPEHDVGSAREAFEALAECGRRLNLQHLSMGMSDDLDDAVRAGATMIRVGSALFGARS
jgi:PLP dependent protein